MASIQMVGHLVKCGGCGRSILLEEGLIGVSHTISRIATCWECLTPEQQVQARVKYQVVDKDAPR